LAKALTWMTQVMGAMALKKGCPYSIGAGNWRAAGHRPVNTDREKDKV
jgi:hypothetical protein